MLARFQMASAPQHTSIDVIASALEPMMPAVSRMSSPDGAVTMMLSDIADAESLAAELGPDAWERLLRDHHALVDQLVGHHDGQVVKFENDGFLASFNSAHGGLYAARGAPADLLRPGGRRPAISRCGSACTRAT